MTSGRSAPGSSSVTAAGSSRRRRAARSVARGLREFAVVPLVVIAGFGCLAAVSVIGDQSHVAVLDAARRAVGHVVGRQASSTTLQAIATGLVTVTSITFSVLLLAVQQTASSLSPVVFDQFVRRKANQAFLGFFVGLALFAYVVMAAVKDGTPPILGAGIATVLTVVALLILLLLVYTTINQMRPANVLRQIHDRTLRARERERPLVRRTRRAEMSRDPVSATYRSDTTGYVTAIDIDRLEAALAEIPDAEIALHVTIGDHIAYGDKVATVRDDDEEDARRLADEVRGAVVVDVQRDVDNDATTGIDELGNIAWTSGSTAKQNPEIAREALHALKDLAARWIEPATGDEDDAPEPLPIVYEDNDLDRVLQTLYSLFVSAHESHQHMTAADVLSAYDALLDRADGELRERLERDLHAATGLIDEMPTAPVLLAARRRLATDRDRKRDGRATADDFSYHDGVARN